MIFRNNTIVFGMISLMMINTSFAMETDVHSLSDSSSSSSSSLSLILSESLMLYAPTKEGILSTVQYYMPTREGVGNIYNSVCGTAGSFYEKGLRPTATSLYNTAAIAYDDNKALIKLGYPIANKTAQFELKKTLENYIEYFNLQRQLSKGEVNYSDNTISQKHTSLRELAGRRVQLIERFAKKEVLESRLDGLNIAKHLITYHDNTVIMSASNKNIITLFIIAQEKAEKDATSEFVKLLTDAKNAVDKMQEANKTNTEKDGSGK